MATASLTLRDLDLFSALDRSPLTVRQLRALSVTFASRFGSERRLQDRLAILMRAGLLHRFRYAALEGTGRYYYTLSPESYRLLHGFDAALPSPGIFRQIGVARQFHTERLADFIVHTLLSAHQHGVHVSDFFRENSLQLTVENQQLYPDCAFTLHMPGRSPFLFYVELDNSTEPLTSPRERDSWIRKLQFYEKLQDTCDERFRVLGLITKSSKRLQNLLSLAATQAANPQRSLFYGVFLPEYLEHAAPLSAKLFTDHRTVRVSLLPSAAPMLASEPLAASRELAPAAAI